MIKRRWPALARGTCLGTARGGGGGGLEVPADSTADTGFAGRPGFHYERKCGMGSHLSQEEGKRPVPQTVFSQKTKKKTWNPTTGQLRQDGLAAAPIPLRQKTFKKKGTCVNCENTKDGETPAFES